MRKLHLCGKVPEWRKKNLHFVDEGGILTKVVR
jgi:hypothetical protein